MAEAAAKTRRCTDRIAALTDDILVEVLLRVGSFKGLFMFAVTCRRWLRRFTDRAFLRRLCPGQGEGHHRARLLGFFFRPTRFVLCQKMVTMRRTQRTSASPPTFVPTPGSPLGPAGRALTSFVAADDGTFDYAEPLAARRGIVLMYLLPRTFDLDRRAAETKTTTHLFGICNPITGDRHVPPPLSLECCLGCDCLATKYAIITAADGTTSSSSGRFTFSQLLLITRHREPEVYLHSYSAATRSWSPPAVCLDGSRFVLVGGSGRSSAVIHQGAAHWLCMDRAVSSAPRDDYQLHILSVEVGTARVSMTKVPVRGGGSPLLCAGSDGKLSVACVYPVHVTVWTQQDGDEGDDAAAAWLRTVIRIPMAGPWIPSRPNEEWFDFSRGSMLALHRDDGVFIVDLQKKVMEKVMDCFPYLLNSSSDRAYRLRFQAVQKKQRYIEIE